MRHQTCFLGISLQQQPIVAALHLHWIVQHGAITYAITVNLLLCENIVLYHIKQIPFIPEFIFGVIRIDDRFYRQFPQRLYGIMLIYAFNLNVSNFTIGQHCLIFNA